MTSNGPVGFDILYAMGHSTNPVQLRFSGDGDEPALKVIADALAAVGRADEIDGTSLLLSPRDAFESGDGDTQFLVLTGNETLSELRVLIGADDSAVVLRTGGWGDTQGPELFVWLVEDFLPFGRAALEAYGAVGVMKVVGRAIEKKRYRETREQAADWLRRGGGRVDGRLKEQVESYHSWTVRDAERHFGLSASDTAELMIACGYRFERDTQAYYRLFDGMDVASAS